MKSAKGSLFIPHALSHHVTAIAGERGHQWLADLPQRLKKFSLNWAISIGDCFADASFNYVAPAQCGDGERVVFKAGISSAEFSREIAALRFFDGLGAVRLIQADESEGVMLMEHALPGDLLENRVEKCDPVQCTVDLIKILHRPVKNLEDFLTLADWFNELGRFYQQAADRMDSPFKSLVDRARGMSRDLLDSMREPVLLHGDLHYANVVFSKTRGWLAIDPKGVIGEPEYEIPLPRLPDKPDTKSIIRCLDQFTEYSGFDRQRILHWAFAKAVLAVWWSLEDLGMASQKFIICAEVLENRLRRSIS